MMMQRIFQLLFIAVTLIQAAHGSYNDVAVVVNTNSGTSVAIGEYFRTARSIPLVNMIYVAVDTVEEIDSTVFTLLRSQVENHLVTNNLTNQINYLVTTKGVPLKVNRGNTFSVSSPSASVESELMCILGSYSLYIAGSGRVTSPYYYQNQSFSRTTYGIYLVTRLDGYTLEDILALIDKSGPQVSISPASTFVFDQDPNWNGTLPSLNSNMSLAKTTLESKGKNVTLDGTNLYLTAQSGVVGYTSWGSNDYNASAYTQHAIPGHTWVPGAIAETYVSTSGRTFMSPPVYGQSLIADLIAEGISGAKGYVYEPFSSSMALAQILFDRYTASFNLAESFFMSSRYISWMDVVIGDPKTTIDGSPGPLPVQLYYVHGVYAPSPSRVHVRWGTLSEVNNFGFFVQWKDTSGGIFSDLPGSFTPGHGTTTIPQDYEWTHNEAPQGAFLYRLKQIDLDGSTHFSDPVLVVTDLPANVTSPENLLQRLDLLQNYPNPFNPSTRIVYTNPYTGHVSLTVFNLLGEKIAVLVDEVQDQGSYSVTFSPSSLLTGGLASGRYFYRLDAHGYVIVKQMTLVK